MWLCSECARDSTSQHIRTLLAGLNQGWSQCSALNSECIVVLYQVTSVTV